MKSQLLAAVLLCSLSTFAFAGNGAVNTIDKETTTGAPGSCHGAEFVDVQRLRYSSLSVGTNAAANVACSLEADPGSNGTTRFGGVLLNSTTSNVVIDCYADISSGGFGPKRVPRSVIVGARNATRIEWNAADMGAGKTLFGGQVGFTCRLKPGVSLSWIWSVRVSN